MTSQNKNKQYGQSMIEFAVATPIVLIVLLLTVQFGMYLFGLSIVETAARHGARAGSVSQTCAPCDAIAAAKSATSGMPVVRGVGVSVLAPGGVTGSILKIQVTGNIPIIVPGAEFGLSALGQVKAEATFRQEGW